MRFEIVGEEVTTRRGGLDGRRGWWSFRVVSSVGVVVAVALAAAGCAPAAPRPTAVVAPGAHPGTEREGDGWFRLRGGKVAPWVVRMEERTAGARRRGRLGIFSDADVAGIGVRSAVICSAVGAWVMDLERGVVGPLAVAPGDDVWFGLGTGDRILVADPAGQLYQAMDAAAAMTGFEPLSKVPGAFGWDAVPGLIVATTGDGVWVSTDEGEHFDQVAAPRRSVGVDRVLARPDGVMAAVTADGKVYLSRDRGRRWRESAVQGDIYRQGSWLIIGNRVLSTDGASWTTVTEWPEREPEAWLEAFVLGPGPGRFASGGLPTLLYPAIPSPPRRTSRAADEVASRAGRDGEEQAGWEVWRRFPDEPFEPFGLDYLRVIRLSRLESSIEFVFFSDACAAKEASATALHADQPSSATCARKVHLAVIDQSTPSVRAVEVLPGCDALGVESALGIGLLYCRAAQGGAWVETLDPTGRWFHELRLPASGGLHDQAEDGSVMIELASENGHVSGVAVRCPLPLGAPGAWRKVVIAGAIAYRVGPGGSAVAMVPSSDRRRFELVLSQPGQKPRMVARDIAVEGGIDLLEVDAGGRITMTRHTMDGREMHLALTADGQMLRVEGLPPNSPAKRSGR